MNHFTINRNGERKPAQASIGIFHSWAERETQRATVTNTAAVAWRLKAEEVRLFN